jgi:hypothetical protein
MTKYPRTEEGIRTALEDKINRPVIDDIWDTLWEEGYVEDVLLKKYDGAFPSLLKKYRLMEKEYLTNYSAGRQAGTQKNIIEIMKEWKETPPIKESVVFCRVLAAEVGKLPIVRQFRQDALNGSLLQPEEIETWLETMAEREASLYGLSGRQISPGELENLDTLLKSEEQFPSSTLEFFSTNDGQLKYLDISPAGILGRLKNVAITIINFKAPMWSEHEAVSFALTGQVPHIPTVKGKVFWPFNGQSVVSLTFDARITPQTLAKEYGKIRRQILGSGHVKPISEKHQELAAYAAGKKEGLTWDALMRQWNKDFPKWQYIHTRIFCRDALSAINRVLGIKK